MSTLRYWVLYCIVIIWIIIFNNCWSEAMMRRMLLLISFLWHYLNNTDHYLRCFIAVQLAEYNMYIHWFRQYIVYWDMEDSVLHFHNIKHCKYNTFSACCVVYIFPFSELRKPEIYLTPLFGWQTLCITLVTKHNTL